MRDWTRICTKNSSIIFLDCIDHAWGRWWGKWKLLLWLSQTRLNAWAVNRWLPFAWDVTGPVCSRLGGKSNVESQLLKLLTVLCSISREIPLKKQDPHPLWCRWHIFVYNTRTALTPSRYRTAQWNPSKRPSSKPAAASARYPRVITVASCIHGLRKVNVCSCEIVPMRENDALFFSDFYHFGIFSCGTWAADACCKSYRHNKRCLVLNIHAASREQFPYRCAIRVIPL